MTPDEFRSAGHALVEWIAKYRERLAAAEFPVQSPVSPGDVIAALPAAAPDGAEPFAAVLRDLETIIVPGVTHWQHPRFFGYFPSGGSLASVLGDMISTAFGVVGLNWQSSPALTELEELMTDWVRDLLGLTKCFSGVIQDTASSASFVALVSARERTSTYAAARNGLQDGEPPMVVYTSLHAHSSIEKAASLAGFGRNYVRAIDVDDQYRMNVSILEAAIRRDRDAGLRPCAVVATSGTTATTAMDPIEAIGKVARRENIWLHVDGAMGGTAMLLPEYRHYWVGIEQADSIVINLHKWMSVAFDCSLYYVRDSQHLVRVMSTNPSFLQTSVDAQVRNYRDWGIPLGRRFRALKIWLTLRHHGADGLRARIRQDIESAKWLAQRVDEAPNWRRIAPVTLQTVCVRHEPAELRGKDLDDHTIRWTKAVNDSGRAYLTSAIVNGQWMTRVSIGSDSTSHQHVVRLWNIMREAADSGVCSH